MADTRGLRYIWRTAPRAPRELFSAMPELHPAMVQVLYTRGLVSQSDCLDFVAGVYRDDDEPTLLADLPRAVDRLVQARDRRECVAIFTDYDADGVNSAAVLTTGFRMIGIDPIVKLPNRFRDGYGLTTATVEELHGRGANVIVTADCGSSSHEAALLAKQLGIDLIVTDHHQCGETLPEAYAVVNPWRHDCLYPFDHLCGAGVAFKLLQALADRLLPEGRAAMEPLLDLVAVATVADIMPLTGENRRLVLAGLRIMNAFPRPGVRALMTLAGLEPGEVDAAALGFRVAPRVNAAGRLDDPTVAFNLLMSDDYEEAFALAGEINRMNQERQNITRVLEASSIELLAETARGGAYSLVCGGEDWPQGVVGLVAGRLAQTYNRPALVYRELDGIAVGSGRSIAGFDLLAAMHACGDLFDRYGGHRAAAGFTMRAENLPEMIRRFEAACKADLELRPELLNPVLRLDGFLRPETLSYEFTRGLEQLAPFGQGFAAPTWAMKGLTIAESRTVGETGDHWKLRLRPEGGGYPFEAMYFGYGALAERFRPGAEVDAAFTLKRSKFNGQWKVDMEIVDLAPL